MNHLKFAEAKHLLEQNAEPYFQRAMADVAVALERIYWQQDISPQRLAATFRRGDLLQELNGPPILPPAQPANENRHAR